MCHEPSRQSVFENSSGKPEEVRKPEREKRECYITENRNSFLAVGSFCVGASRGVPVEELKSR